MEAQSSIFKDDTLKGISLAVKNLQHQQTEAQTSNPDANYIITKYNPHFRNLINYLDLSFSFGLCDQRKGYWPFVKKVAHSSVVKIVEEHKKASNEIQKGYIWLFLTFIEDSLECYMKMMIDDSKSLKFFYKNYALLRDVERREILFNLLAGIECLTFSLMFDDPYLDYGHDPVLRQEKIVIRVQPPPKLLQQQHSNQPDVTLANKTRQSPTYPDLISGKTPSTMHQSDHSSVGGAYEVNELVLHVKKRKKKRRTVSENDTLHHQLQDEPIDFTHDAQLEEDNFIPEIIGSPEYTVCLPKEDRSSTPQNLLLHTSDPMLKSFSSAEDKYHEFLNSYAKDDERVESLKNKGISLLAHDNESVTNEIETSMEDVETTLKRMTMQDHEDDDQDEPDYGITRTDSFDRFCRKGTPDISSLVDEQGILAETDDSAPPVGVAPEVTEESLRLSRSPALTPVLSKTSIEKLNDARLDTKSGILLPALPRRPKQNEAMKMVPEITLDRNAQVLISLEIFQEPTESLANVFEVFVGHLAGLSYPMHLLISNSAIYLLKRKENIQSGYISMLSIKIDGINKVQVGLNFQDVYFIHDGGCVHISTADEISSRGIVSAVKSVIKSNFGKTEIANQPMADNTNNDLDLIIQDWLICNSGMEEPEIHHFALLKYSQLSSSKQKRKVMKASNVYFRQSMLGVMSRWEEGFFVLRGHVFNHYAIKRNELKHSYDLSLKCGGCIRSGSDGNLHIFKIIGVDGKTPILELALENENEANDWLMTICQVVADAKNSGAPDKPVPGKLVSCGLVLTSDKLFLFNQDPKSGRLLAEDTCLVQDITQVCVDNQNRTYCTLTIDHLEETDHKEKTIWLLSFHSEYELGKFEGKLFSCWQNLYQVPLQFVLLSDDSYKKTIQNVLAHEDKFVGDLGKNLLLELIAN